MDGNIGILGLGNAFPSIERTNDWWPDEIVATWRTQQSSAPAVDPEAHADDPQSQGTALARQAMLQDREDPFRGARRRFVLGPDDDPVQLQLAAARAAIEDAGIDRRDVGALFVQSTLPSYVHQSDAASLHQHLELDADCLSFSHGDMCNGFQIGFCLADGLLRRLPRRVGLLIQCSMLSPFLRQEDAFSAWFGDAVTAIVVGPVADGFGFLGSAHETDGRVFPSIVSGVPGRPWYDEGPVTTYVQDPLKARQMLLGTPEAGRKTMNRVLEQAGLRHADVDFYAAHQGVHWFREVTQQHLGLAHARSEDTFAELGSALGSNIPLVLDKARRKQTLHDGDLVASFSGASGMGAASLLFRWGTG